MPRRYFPVSNDPGRDREPATVVERAVSRRDLLKVMGAGAGLAALSPILAACGAKSSPGAAGGSQAPIRRIAPPATAVNLDFWNPFTGGDGPFLKGIVEKFNA